MSKIVAGQIRSEHFDRGTHMQADTATGGNQKLIELEKMKEDLEDRLKEMSRTVKKQETMIALAKRDPLTGLRNRQGIPELVSASLRAHCEGTFFIMDLDNFKSVNDTYGHMEGDRVLIRFAKALRVSIDPDDITARLGGDEFVVFSPGHYDKYELKAKAKRFIRQIERSLLTPGKPMQVTVSIGIARAPLDGATYEALYENADKALYSVKNEGKNGFRFFDELNDPAHSTVLCGTPHTSLEEITNKLREQKTAGSFEVDYTNFEQIYRFMERNLIRDPREIQCVLFTLEACPDAEAMVIQQQLAHLQHAVAFSLRKSDVTTTYSSTQLLALLIDANRENTDMVVKRILRKYRTEAGSGRMEVLYDMQQLTPVSSY